MQVDLIIQMVLLRVLGGLKIQNPHIYDIFKKLMVKSYVRDQDSRLRHAESSVSLRHEHRFGT